MRSTGIRRSVSEGTLNQCHTLSAIRPKSLREFLKTPLAPKRSRGRGPTPKGRVLTSRDNLLLLENEEKKKREAAQLKEERRIAREKKQQLKQNKQTRTGKDE